MSEDALKNTDRAAALAKLGRTRRMVNDEVEVKKTRPGGNLRIRIVGFSITFRNLKANLYRSCNIHDINEILHSNPMLKLFLLSLFVKK
jgi:hypothetical protein